MIAGRWGTPQRTLLDLAVDASGNVTGIANPGRENAVIRAGRFDVTTGTLHLEGDYAEPGKPAIGFAIDGALRGRELELSYRFGALAGKLTVGRVEDYRPKPLTIGDRIAPYVAGVKRRLVAFTRPSRTANARRLRERGESLESIVLRDATEADIEALAELHVTTWNATYNTTRGPTVATRASQWRDVFRQADPQAFVLLLVDRNARLIGFAHGKPDRGLDGFTGQLSKIYLRWEYHGLGLGRLMMGHAARRFLERGIESFCLFADTGNPTIGFYDRLGGERLTDDRGRFHGAYGWRDARALAERCLPD